LKDCETNDLATFELTTGKLEFLMESDATSFKSFILETFHMKITGNGDTQNLSPIMLGAEKTKSYMILVLNVPNNSYFAKNFKVTLLESGTTERDLLHDVLTANAYGGENPNIEPYSKIARLFHQKSVYKGLFTTNALIIVELDNFRGFFSNARKPLKITVGLENSFFHNSLS